ncbi:CZB domain-containing protein [Sphingomonas quercus]|uniref:CZB domain-containing protein n=1 Tax=Sphingomonas quercus TaxID=2842451 RepID=A0ABS6BN75_9SPHN|nr:CZB domain-containing protein [Sphingomonas quercus]MBU3079102.1 CZB domain-containing protein [Sphingomonas quercus]
MASHLVKGIADGIGAHGLWKMRLRSAISSGISDANVAEVRCDDKCAFGKWLHHSPEIDAGTKGGLPYKVVKRLHAEFHVTAADVLAHALHGRKTQASALFETEFSEKSEKLVRALMKWKGELQ